MSSESLAKAIQKMNSSLTEKLVGFSSKVVREMTQDIKHQLEVEYNLFFLDISEEVIGKMATPGIFAGTDPWKPLGEKWVFQKRKEGNFATGTEHYLGLSHSLTSGKQLGRSRKGGKDIGMSRLKSYSAKSSRSVKVGPFIDYIHSLQSAGTMDRFFGPITVGYDFVAPNANFTVTVSQSSGFVQRVQVRSAARGTFVAFPKELKMKANIEAFGKLKGVAFNEKSVVDFIIKRVDPANEKQWVKINSSYGFGRSHRPIRAVITPMLRYYIKKRFPEIVQRAIKQRSK